MQALYTETFEDFLKRHEQSEEWQAIVTKLGKFPRFTLGDLDFDIYTLIKEKFKIWEIGAETEALFIYEFNDSVNELSIKYIPKIEMYISNFANMLERKIALGSDGQTDNILYPVATTAGKVATSVKFNSNKDNPLMIFKSNGELLAQAMDIKNIYLDCLADFEKNFMTIY
jgi:hypothetical protein